jgi:hypothetical protein
MGETIMECYDLTEIVALMSKAVSLLSILIGITFVGASLLGVLIGIMAGKG